MNGAALAQKTRHDPMQDYTRAQDLGASCLEKCHALRERLLALPPNFASDPLHSSREDEFLANELKSSAGTISQKTTLRDGPAVKSVHEAAEILHTQADAFCTAYETARRSLVSSFPNNAIAMRVNTLNGVAADTYKSALVAAIDVFVERMRMP